MLEINDSLNNGWVRVFRTFRWIYAGPHSRTEPEIRLKIREVPVLGIKYVDYAVGVGWELGRRRGKNKTHVDSDTPVFAEDVAVQPPFNLC